MSPSETTPLIKSTSIPLSSSSSRVSSTPHELHWLSRNSVPVAGFYLLNLLSKLTYVSAFGHLGPNELAGSALGTMFTTITSSSVALGTLNALDTLCGQAWTGSKDKTLVGLHLQKSIVVLVAWHVILAPLWLNATRLFVAIGQDPDVALFAGIYLRYDLFGAPAYCCFEAIRKYLQSQGIMGGSTGVLMLTTPLTVILTYTLAFMLNLGFDGVMLASTITSWLMLTLLIGYTYLKCERHHETSYWGGWNSACLNDWKPYLGYAIPGIVNLASEWWCFELVSLGASYLSTKHLAAQSILMCLDQLCASLGWGLSAAVATRVSNRIGSICMNNSKDNEDDDNSSNSIKATLHAAWMLAVAMAVALVLVTLLPLLATFGQLVGLVFTNDRDIVHIVAQVMPLFGLYLAVKFVGQACTGIMRGMGRPDITTYININAYYVIGFPVAYILTFKAGWALVGLWIGLCLAMFLAASAHLAYISSINWRWVTQSTYNRIKCEQDRLVHSNAR